MAGADPAHCGLGRRTRSFGPRRHTDRCCRGDRDGRAGSYDSVLGSAQLLAAALGGGYGAWCVRSLLAGGAAPESSVIRRVLGGCFALLAAGGLALTPGQDPTRAVPDEHEHDHTSGFVAPFDPALPTDFSGVAGATPAQRATAGQLLESALPIGERFATVEAAERVGFVSAGDAASGYEHFVHAGHLGDDGVLDPARPEILVFEVDLGGQRVLALVEYALALGTPLDQAPEVGGPITAWEQRRDLCLSGSGSAPGSTEIRFDGFAGADGRCRDRSSRARQSAVLDVWLVANPCGPFATIEDTRAAPDDDGLPTCGRSR